MPTVKAVVGPENSCCLQRIVVVQAVDDGQFDHLARVGWWYGSPVGCVLV